MKKIIGTMLLALLLGAVFVGCPNQNTPPPEKEDNTSVESQENTSTDTPVNTQNGSNDAGVSKISVKGTEAIQDSSYPTKYAVVLPKGTDLSKLEQSDIVVELKDSNAKVDYKKSSNTKWEVTVTAEDKVTSVLYTLILEVAPEAPATLTSITGINNIGTPDNPSVSFILNGNNFTTATKNNIKCKRKTGAEAYAEVTISSATFANLVNPPTYTVTINFPKNDTSADISYQVIFSVDGGETYVESIAETVTIKGQTPADVYSIMAYGGQDTDIVLTAGNLKTDIIVMAVKDGGGTTSGLSNDKIKVGIFFENTQVTNVTYFVTGDKAKRTINLTFPATDIEKKYTIKVNATGSESEFQTSPQFTVTVPKI